MRKYRPIDEATPRDGTVFRIRSKDCPSERSVKARFQPQSLVNDDLLLTSTSNPNLVFNENCYDWKPI